MVRAYARRRVKRVNDWPVPVIRMANPHGDFVAEVDGRRVGMLLGSFRGEFRGHAEIASVDVDLEYRRRGIGTALVKAFEREAEKRGIACISTTAYGEDALKFWVAQGYEGEEEIDDYCPLVKCL